MKVYIQFENEEPTKWVETFQTEESELRNDYSLRKEFQVMLAQRGMFSWHGSKFKVRDEEGRVIRTFVLGFYVEPEKTDND